MIKFVISNKTLLLFINRVPLLRRCFVYDFSKLNIIEDESLYNLVFSHIIVSNGLTKTTKSNRFADLDIVILNRMKNAATTRFHDIGVSNGVTSLELYDKMQQHTIPARFCISDKYARIYYKGGAIKKFYDADGHLISVNYLFVHLSPYIGKIFFLSRWLFNLFNIKADLNKKDYKEILLLAPAVYKKVLEGSIELLQFDVFTTSSGRAFTFLRCLNVLMTGYFSKQQIMMGVNNLKDNLEEGGCLLLGRTDASNINHATFYTKSNNQLMPVEVVNNGFDYNNPA